MLLRRIAFTFLLLSGLALAHAASVAGRYRAQVEGVDTLLTLDVQGGQITGSYAEGSLRFNVRGEQQGGALRLSVRDPASDLEIAQIDGPLQGEVFDAQIRAQNPLTGQRRESQARFMREGARATPAPPAGGALDTRLVGVWTSSENLGGSGGPNPGGFSTVRIAQITADGRISQWSESAGGGADWSYGSGRELEFSGRWQARDGILYVHADGGAGFEAATRYRFADPYLVTETDRGKTIWQRR
jgi:hypothetical protein